MSIDGSQRRFLSYIDKSREFYAAQGFEPSYRWARPSEAPALQRLSGPLSGARLGVITSAFPLVEHGPQPVELPYAHAVDPLPTGRFSAHENRDTFAAAANERESFLPLLRMQELVAAGRIGSLSPRFYGVPFDYSPRRTTEQDAPAVLELLQADAVDVALLVPHCPVCHQSVALTARFLEASGVATVVVGSARDIIEEIGVPRFLFVDFPLGYPMGRPGQPDQQRQICAQALDLLEGAWAPRTTVQASAEWGDDQWRVEYMKVDDTTRAALAAAGEQRRDHQRRVREEGRTRTT
ncbi:MAG: glycine reductase [Acidimicrobiales bacterium]